MKLDLKGILEALKNKYFPREEIKQLIEETSAKRITICMDCEFNSIKKQSERPDFHCTVCGCNLDLKTKCLSCKCPLTNPLWTPIITKDEEKQINESL